MPKDAKLDSSQVKKAQETEKKEQNKYILKLSEKQEKELIERVCYLVTKDEADRKEYIDLRKKVRDAYEAKTTVKSDPWVNCANVKTQLVHMSVELLHSRLFPAAWNEDLVYWKPSEKLDVENVENVNKFMKWVTREIPLSSVIDDFVHNLILDGTAVMKIRWVVTFKWVQRKILKQDSVMSKIKKVVMRFIGGKKERTIEQKQYEVKYEYKKFETCKVEVLDLEDTGFPLYSIPLSKEEELEYFWHRTYTSLSELKELESFGVYKNVDSVGEYIEDILIEGTKKSSVESEGVKITQNKLNYKTEVIEFYDKYDYNNDGMREDIVVTIEKKSKTFLDARLLTSVSRSNEKPFVVGQFIRRPNRMLGKGAGEIALPFEEEANAIHNQRLDAGTMSITPFGVYRAGSGFKPENIQMEPGLWIPVDDVNDAKWVVVPNNVMVSFQEERMLMELLEKILSVGSYQSGQESDVNRSRSTARGTMAIIQQGEIRFAILGRRIQIPLTRMLNKVLHQWQDKIPPGTAIRVLGVDGDELFPDGISPEDLAGNYDSYMSLDSTGGSKQADREVKGWVYQNFMQNPFVMRNPTGLWILSAQVLKTQGVENVEEILGPMPIQQNLSRKVEEENALFMQGQAPEVKETDNVLEHLLGHYAFRDSVDYVAMPPEYRNNFDVHLKATHEQVDSIGNKIGDSIMGLANQALGQGMPQLPQGGMNGGPAQGTAMGSNQVPGMGAPMQPNGNGEPVAPEEVAGIGAQQGF